MDFSGVKKIAVIKLRHIGDVLLTVPVFRALRETFPDSRIAAIVNSGTDAVLSGSPMIDEIITVERGVKHLPAPGRYIREAGFLLAIRKKRFDMTVDLTGGDRAAILSYASGARYRLGWKSSKGFMGKKYLYTHSSKPDIRAHMVLQNLEVVRPFGITTKDLSVGFHVPQKDREFVDKLLQESPAPGGPIVHIHPTSRWLFKCWNDNFMADVILSLLRNGAKVIVTSSASRREITRAGKILSLTGMHPRLVNLCGMTTLKQVGAVSQRVDLFFGVDSAPMHIAAAIGTPVVALFGPSDPRNWGPWPNDTPDEAVYARRSIQAAGGHTVIQRDWKCVPCREDGCGGSKVSRCLEDIGPEEVMAILSAKLRAAAK